MPIKVTCQFGQKFSARDELLGKRVKCPKCGGVLTIRQAPVATVIPVERPPEVPTVPTPKSLQEPVVPSSDGSVAVKLASAKLARSSSASDARGWILVDAGLTICFRSLILGCGTFAIVLIDWIMVIHMNLKSSPSPRDTNDSGFLGIMLTWSAFAWLASHFALVIAWGLCLRRSPKH